MSLVGLSDVMARRFSSTQGILDQRGGLNTRYFHGYVNKKIRRNNIVALQVEHKWIENVEEVCSEIFKIT